jgi:uncharacterized membrane protein YczE
MKEMERGKDQLVKRILMSAIGVLICGISVGMFKRAELGVDPFQSLMSGLNAVIPIRFGTLYLIANALLLLFALVFDRRKIGLATVINLVFFGYIAEFVQKLLLKAFPEMNLAARLILLLAAVILMCLATAFYFTADLGVSTYDAVSLIISQKQSRVAFQYCRIISDFVCVILGVCLCLIAGYTFRQVGASVGIGTIITAFFMGPLIEWFNVHVARPFLKGRGAD